jgi:Predicted amidohydrolase
MLIALIQVASPELESVADRRTRVGDLVAEAAGRGATLVVLPELWPSGYFAFDQYEALAEPLNGDTVSAMSEWARASHVQLLGGSFLERGDGGAVHNTSVLFDAAGTLTHSYRKIHVFGYQSQEAKLLEPGRSIGVVDTGFGVLGATTCYDLRFPELYRLLVDQGAQVVVVPAAWPAARLEHWRLLTQVRAVENQVFVLACNAVGEQAGVRLGGHSRVVDPWGVVLAEAGDAEEILYCEIDLERVTEVRTEFPVLKDRRLFVDAGSYTESSVS